jgi:hypothetical protein
LPSRVSTSPRRPFRRSGSGARWRNRHRGLLPRLARVAQGHHRHPEPPTRRPIWRGITEVRRVSSAGAITSAASVMLPGGAARTAGAYLLASRRAGFPRVEGTLRMPRP